MFYSCQIVSFVFSSPQKLPSGRWPFCSPATRRYFWRRWCDVGVCRAKCQRGVGALESSYRGGRVHGEAVHFRFFWSYEVCTKSYVKTACTSQKFMRTISAKYISEFRLAYSGSDCFKTHICPTEINPDQLSSHSSRFACLSFVVFCSPAAAHNLLGLKSHD